MPPKTHSLRPPANRRRTPTQPAVNPDFDGIRELAASLQALHRQMAATCAPSVQSIIQSRSRDQRQIEHLLDRLLNCACIPEGLSLFRTLCRYYFTFNPTATADYIAAYRDMWDNNDAEEAKA